MKTNTVRTILVVAAFAAVGVVVLARASDQDDKVENAAKNSYVFKHFLANDSVDVEAEAGIVTLSGEVSSPSHKMLAESTVAALPGVKQVKNEIELKDKKVSMGSDAWVATKVKSTLLLHAHVNGMATNVDVNNGIVTLRGEAENEAQRELTAEYANDIEGVKGLKNEMTVLGSEKLASRVERKMDSTATAIDQSVDDASVTAQVKVLLFSHRSTSALNTKIDTVDGVVTLRGEAANEAEKSLAEKLASDVAGVKSVNNLMTVKKASS